jgi:hypothetical protein
VKFSGVITNATVSSAVGLGNIPTTWSITLVGDYNSDGMSDLLWRDTHRDLVHERRRDIINRCYRQRPDELDRSIGQC